jgi:hypothetical protein
VLVEIEVFALPQKLWFGYVTTFCQQSSWKKEVQFLVSKMHLLDNELKI